MNLKQGIDIFKSERGHRGFLYPSADPLILSSDTSVSLLPWVGSTDKVAVLIHDDAYVHTWKEKSKISGTAWVKKSDIEKVNK